MRSFLCLGRELNNWWLLCLFNILSCNLLSSPWIVPLLSPENVVKCGQLQKTWSNVVKFFFQVSPSAMAKIRFFDSISNKRWIGNVVICSQFRWTRWTILYLGQDNAVEIFSPCLKSDRKEVTVNGRFCRISSHKLHISPGQNLIKYFKPLFRNPAPFESGH